MSLTPSRVLHRYPLGSRRTPHKDLESNPHILWLSLGYDTIGYQSGTLEAFGFERVFDRAEEPRMKFSRTYSVSGDPYAGVAFEPRTSRIVNPDGSVIFEAKHVMVPVEWTQVAVDVLAQKYCRKAGVPTATVRVAEDDVPAWLQRSIADDSVLEALTRDEQFGPERDARQVFNRMAGCWTYWGWKYGYFDSENDARIYYD